jgi:alpha-tubulin suppressor-like RCC1 family protein
MGQLGDGTFENHTLPTSVSGNSVATQLTAGVGHACALEDGGTVTCWGYPGAVDSGPLPARVDGLGEVVSIAAGRYLSCALEQDGSLWCWEGNTPQVAPELVGQHPGAIEVAAGPSNTVCVHDAATVFGCYALESDGWHTAPAPPSSLDSVRAMALGPKTSCMVAESGEALCWGLAVQLGTGRSNADVKPVVRGW